MEKEREREGRREEKDEEEKPHLDFFFAAFSLAFLEETLSFKGAHFFFDLNSKTHTSSLPPLLLFLLLLLSPLHHYHHPKLQDAKGACSFNENFANTMSSASWTAGTMVSIAMNHDQFNGGKGCGTCIMYRGIGGGVGVTPLSTTQWTMGIVNNQCPECHKGSIDQNINGDGRWNVEWFAVPCNVGDGKIKYSRIDNLGAEYWALVVSNTRVPVKSLQIKIDGEFEFCFVFFVFCFFGGVFLEFWRGKLSFSPSLKIFKKK